MIKLIGDKRPIFFLILKEQHEPPNACAILLKYLFTAEPFLNQNSILVTPLHMDMLGTISSSYILRPRLYWRPAMDNKHIMVKAKMCDHRESRGPHFE